MYKAVIFDLNGVFLQSEYLSNRFSAKYGIPEEEFMVALKDVMGQVRKPKAPPAYTLWNPYFEKWNLNISENEFWQFWFSGEKLDDKLVEYSKKLKSKGIKVFILSNNFKERTEYYRRHFPEIFSVVDKAYFSWETGFVKPSIGSLQLLLTQNRLQPSDCIYFDDSDKNLEVARSVGIRSEMWVDLPTAKKQIGL